MLKVSYEAPVYLYTGVTDMRGSFDRLAEKVRVVFSRTPFSGGVYVFFSKRRDRVKILAWDLDGYLLLYKRLEVGTFKVENIEGTETITGVDLEALLSGVELSRIKFQKSAEKGLSSGS
jgi:transposase